MSGRPTQKKADIPAIQNMLVNSKKLVDLRPVIALTMRSCGCTFEEIGQVFDISRQMAETLIKKAEREL